MKSKENEISKVACPLLLFPSSSYFFRKWKKRKEGDGGPDQTLIFDPAVYLLPLSSLLPSRAREKGKRHQEGPVGISFKREKIWAHRTEKSFPHSMLNSGQTTSPFSSFSC